MGKVIAVANQKGGCGKTITSINLAASLAFLGKKVLVVDLDSQAHSTLGLGVNPEELEKSLYDVFDLSAESVTSISDVTHRIVRNLDLAPAHIILSAIEQKLSGVHGRERILADRLQNLKPSYDFIIIDCSPNLGLLTFNAITSADAVLIPVEPSFFAVHGLNKLTETVSLVKDIMNKKIDVYSILTMYNDRTRHARGIIDEVKELFGDRNFRTVIRKNIRLQDAAQSGKPITEFDKNSNGFKDYVNAAVELIERFRAQSEESSTTFAQAIETDHGIQSLLESLDEELAQLCEHLDDQEAVLQENLIEGASKLSHSEDEGALAVACAQAEAHFAINSAEAESVFVAGTFNSWTPEPMNRNEGTGLWEKTVALEPGSYQYKFVVDGKWITDPSHGNTVVNEFADENSIIEIK